MKKYTQHSPTVIHNRYSVTKVCIEFDRISLITNQKITVTIYIAIIMDLLKNNADYDSEHYDNIDEFKFIGRVLTRLYYISLSKFPNRTFSNSAKIPSTRGWVGVGVGF